MQPFLNFWLLAAAQKVLAIARKNVSLSISRQLVCLRLNVLCYFTVDSLVKMHMQ